MVQVLEATIGFAQFLTKTSASPLFLAVKVCIYKMHNKMTESCRNSPATEE